MVNIYLFIELLHTASAVTTVDTLKALAMLHAMPDDAAATMRADRRERGDGAFE